MITTNPTLTHRNVAAVFLSTRRSSSFGSFCGQEAKAGDTGSCPTMNPRG